MEMDECAHPTIYLLARMLRQRATLGVENGLSVLVCPLDNDRRTVRVANDVLRLRRDFNWDIRTVRGSGYQLLGEGLMPLADGTKGLR